VTAGDTDCRCGIEVVGLDPGGRADGTPNAEGTGLVARGWKKHVGTMLTGSLLFGGAVTSSVVLGAPPASAATAVVLYVSTSGSGVTCDKTSPCSSIQAAVDAARGGTYTGDNVTVDVAAGTYTENDSISASSLSSLSIAGAGASTTTVNGNQKGPVLTVSTGSVTISGLTIENGSAPTGTGGGIFNSGALTVAASAITSNDALGGGGIENDKGTLTVSGSTISGNGGEAGGGIETVDGTLTVSGSTFWGNTAINGGGIEALSSSLTITDSTLSGNDATTDGGGILTQAGTESIGATIVAGNAGSNCAVGTGGTVTSVGHNLTDDATGAGCGFTQPTDVVNARPQLGPLTGNGGPTETLLPALGSPAIGVIPSSPATTVNGVTVCPRTDQRGVASDGSCTIGAVEGGFLISTASLPPATPSLSYGPVHLSTQESASGATFRWAKVAGPKWLKMSRSGVLSGIPPATLRAGSKSITVKVTEVSTGGNTTVQATIGLTVT
jgi:hypothetical protein